MKKRILFILILLLLTPLTFALSQEQRQEYRECSSDCRDMKKDERNICRTEYKGCREDCDDTRCKINCARERISCMKQTNSQYRECKSDCRELLIPKCEFNNEIFQAGDEFANGCETCECRRNGKIRCKQDSFCNKDPEITESQCENSGGLYQALCRGGNFHLYCNREEYCICGGDENYACPIEYDCLYDFEPPYRRTNTIPVWVDMLGSPLGEIGICVK